MMTSSPTWLGRALERRRSRLALLEMTDEQLKDIETRVKATIDDAVEFAMNAPDPDPADGVTDLYA